VHFLSVSLLFFSPFFAPLSLRGQTGARGKLPFAQYCTDIAIFNAMGTDETPKMPPGMVGTQFATGRDGRHAKGVCNVVMTNAMRLGSPGPRRALHAAQRNAAFV
jgi:hypothetical protein